MKNSTAIAFAKARNPDTFARDAATVWRDDTIAPPVGADHRTARESVTKERLTGLSNELRGETFIYENGALVSHSISSFDQTSLTVTETNETATAGVIVTKSQFGRTTETESAAGKEYFFFDPYGRVFYTEKDGRSVDWIGRNDYGDVVEYDAFHSSGDNVYAEFYGYDSFGNLIVATNALGAVTFSAYDADNRHVESGGAVYPVRYGYDTSGRRTSLTTFRDAGTGGPPSPATVGDTTLWAFDPATGNCTSKTYADGSTATYTRTPDGLPLRETKPSGTWKENVYDASRQIVGVVSSDGAQDASM